MSTLSSADSQVTKLASALLYCCSLLRNNNMATNLQRFISSQTYNQEGHLPPPELFKTLHSNFDICRNFQIIKLKYCILILFKKSLIRIFLCLTD